MSVVGECQWETRNTFSEGRIALMQRGKELSKPKLKCLFNVTPSAFASNSSIIKPGWPTSFGCAKLLTLLHDVSAFMVRTKTEKRDEKRLESIGSIFAWTV